MSYFDYEKNPYGIDKNAHYFVPLHPLEGILGLIYYTSSNSPEVFVECEIVEDEYKVDDGYKVKLRSLSPWFGSRTFYQQDFISFLESGRGFPIFKKESESEHVEYYSEREYLTDNVYVVLEGSQIVGGNN